jgi:predicted RND superfamily exporter protein
LKGGPILSATILSLSSFSPSLITAGVLIYTLNHFRIDTELTDMISDKVPYRKLEKEFQSAFPQLKETIVVVIDADTPETARLVENCENHREKSES